MKSSSGKYFIGLDHLRALATFMVFTWHFIHVREGQLAPPPIFPLSLLTEGHTGVALFMTLSGYLFAKLLDGKNINYFSFIWNRFLRLGPLLILIILIVGITEYFSGNSLLSYSKRILFGLVKPSFPNGGWSITVEFHFYVLLPFLLFCSRKSKFLLAIILVICILARGVLYQELGEIHKLSYWTIVGRIDQFLLGIIAYQFREYLTGKHILGLGVFILFSIFYWYFDMLGGFYKNPSYPSPSSIWIIMPTLEGVAYASLISWYDNSFRHTTGRISRFIALVGTYSYSIYLWHFFIVFKISSFIDIYIIDLSNIYLAMIFSIFGFLLMIPIGYLSFRFIESPFLKLRTRYIVSDEVTLAPKVAVIETFKPLK